MIARAGQRWFRRLLAVGVTASAVAGALPGSFAHPDRAVAQPSCARPGDVIAPVPWAQRMLRFDRVWPLTTGSGTTVAVLDSGVDATHPQLATRVLAGQDYLHGKGAPGDHDCVGHGTAVASLIAGRAAEGTGFRGVAPGAMVLPVTVSEQQGDADTGQSEAVSPADFGAALSWAVSAGARVVNLSVVFTVDYPEVRQAVEFAIKSDVVVVAAVGNAGASGNPTPYPAAYDGVVGVGGIDQQGLVLPSSGRGRFVDLVAPGDAIVAATPGHGHATWRGTSFAAPFVSGTAALVRQYWPRLTAQQVADRLVATASPMPGGRGSPAYGNGVVDPYRAVTERADPDPSRSVAASPAAVVGGAMARLRRARWLARSSMTIGVGVSLLAGGWATAVVISRAGRRRRWRPQRASPVAPRSVDPDADLASLFDDFP